MLPNDPVMSGKALAVDCVLIGSGLALLFALAFLLDWTKPGAAAKAQAAGPSPQPARRLEPAE